MNYFTHCPSAIDTNRHSIDTGASQGRYNNMKYIPIFWVAIFVASFSPLSHGADCADNNYILSSQAQVNSFPTGCDTIRGRLVVRGADINDLRPLAELTSIGSSLLIRNNTSLTSLTGLDNLTSVGAYLRIQNNGLLADLDGLSSLESIGTYLFIRDNATLVDTSGLSTLTSIGSYIHILNNDALVQLGGLTGVTSISSHLRLRNNNALADISGLASLTSIGGFLQIQNNDALQNVDGLAALSSIGGNLIIRGNPRLLNIDALADIPSVPGNLLIRDNRDLVSLDGLSSITSTTGYLNLLSNPALTNVDGLAALENVGTGLDIRDNDGLTNVDGLARLVSVGNNARVDGNAVLNACTGLVALLDEFDDAAPGPGVAPTPDVGGTVTVSANGGSSCNSQAEILGTAIPPVFSQLFSPAVITLGFVTTTSTLEFTIDNSASIVRATELAFANTLPAGLILATPANAGTSCMGGSLTASDGTALIDYSDGLVAAGASCSVTVDVIGAVVGNYTNTSGPLTFTLGNSGSSTARLRVQDSPTNRSYTGSLPSGATGTLSFTSADPGCGFSETPRFLSDSSANPPPPDSIELIDGVVQFSISGCSAGATVDISMDYGSPLPANTQYWKVATPWRMLGANLSGSAIQFSITDGGADDDDGLANGEIVDPSGAAVPRAPVIPMTIPVNQPLMLLLLTLLIPGFLLRHQRTHPALFGRAKPVAQGGKRCRKGSGK